MFSIEPTSYGQSGKLPSGKKFVRRQTVRLVNLFNHPAGIANEYQLIKEVSIM